MKKRVTALILVIAILCGSCFMGGCVKDDAISNALPTKNERVIIINDDMYDFFTNYECGYSKKYAKEVNNYAPTGVILSWETEKAPDKCEVLVDTDKNLYDAKVYETADNDILINNLYTGTKYYWQVKVHYGETVKTSKVYTFVTEKTCRTVYIDGVVNTRDLGGLKTMDGKTVKQGLIYRGANLDGITEQGKYTFVNELGIKTDLDLRKDGEGLAGGEKSPAGCEKYINIDSPLYGGIADKKEAFRDEIKTFADESNYPIYFHCQIGRDRTGTLGFFLGCILGINEKWLYREYELSSFNELGGNDPVGLVEGNMKPTTNLFKDMKGKNVNEKAVNYLKTIGVTDEDIAEIRRIMLE